MTKLTLTTNQQLFNIAKKYGITRQKLSVIVGFELDTVNKWALPVGVQNHRIVKTRTLQSLKLAILCYQTVPHKTLKASGILDLELMDTCNIPKVKGV